VNALTVSARDAAATAARWSFRIYHPFLDGDSPALRGAGTPQEVNAAVTGAHFYE
jgi:hypothetical protein